MLKKPWSRGPLTPEEIEALREDSRESRGKNVAWLQEQGVQSDAFSGSDPR
jgi:hypothetical protein